MSTTPRSPLVVVDWNFLQTVSADDFRRNRLCAPASWDFLIPESASHEVLEKTGNDRGSAEQHLRKLVGFCREYRERFWLGKSSGPITELSPRVMRIADVVEIEPTLSTRRSIMQGEDDFAKLVEQGRAFDGHTQFKKCEDGFVELSAQAREFLKHYDPQYKPEHLSDDEITKWVRDPKSALRWLPKQWVKSKGLTDAQITQFPDIVPMARWFRVHVWYDLQRYKTQPNTKRDRAFSNCFADADAVFLSSYTGHLLTNDGGQQKAAIAIRPDVRIWEWDCRSRCLRRVH